MAEKTNGGGRKAIRIQVDMIYSVPDEGAENIYEDDLNFFRGIEHGFHFWGKMPDAQEPRRPISFDLRHHIGQHIEEEE